MQCEVAGIPEPIRVVIVNNYPLAANEIATIVAGFSSDARFEWHVIFRERTLDPIDNWYSAIADHGLADEVVFLHSDDDIFLPWSLRLRYDGITNRRGDVLFAHLGPTAFFLDGATQIFCPRLPPHAGSSQVKTITASEVARYAPQHLSNHCYRNTECFRRALARGMDWCNSLDWLDFNARTLMLPLYLPFAVILEGGQVLGLEAACILRGQDLDEVARVPFGVANWNTGFIHLPAWHILRNTELGPIRSLDGLRDEYATIFVQWFLTYFLDKRVGWKKVRTSMQSTGFSWWRLVSPKIMFGLKLLASDWLKIRTWRIRRKTEAARPTGDFLESLRQLTPADGPATPPG